MLFNSYIFMLFLPIVWLGYFGLHRWKLHKSARLFLMLASFVFYGYNHLSYLFLLLGSIIGNYGIYCLLRKMSQKEESTRPMRKAVMLLGVAANLAVIFYFKYYDFFIENINALFRTDFTLLHILLPLGISFFTFQQVSFVIDTYRGETGEYSLLDYSLFVSFFPQLVAGPIMLHQDLIPQFADEKRYRPQWERMTVGLRYFVMGLFKKVMVADRFGYIVSAGHVYPFERDTVGTALIILAYTLQIYFDFSGYSDMAIGLGKMFGFDIPINFKSPYKAVTISEFWDRWHITMTRFFTKYLYFPLGGSRKGLARTCINVMIVFALSGLWHGAAWTFVAWGVMHGIAQVLYRLFKKTVDRIPRLLLGLGTFCYVNMAWVLFRAESLGQAYRIVRCLFTGGFSGDNLDLYMAFMGDTLELVMENIFYTGAWVDVAAVVFTLLCIAAALLTSFCAPSSHEIANREAVHKNEGILWAVMAFLCFMNFSNVSTFLYFNF